MSLEPDLSGFLLINKMVGPTSHRIVACIRRVLQADKVGHLGTLDPFASGLLPIMVGNAARLFDEVLDGKKGYLFGIELGTETDTLDHTGRVVETASVPPDFAARGLAVISQFLGLIEQIPPVYSALKMEGRPLYEHMRATGKLPQEIESKKRKVTIHTLELVEAFVRETQEAPEPKCTLVYRVVCSKGTYVRSLARDISKALGTVGHCATLRRELVEPWNVGEALVLDPQNPPSREQLLERLEPAEKMVPQIPLLLLPTDVLKPLQSGNSFLLSEHLLSSMLSSKLSALFNFKVHSLESANATPLNAPLSDSLPANLVSPERALVRCEGLTYLAEITHTPLGLRVQPRKKIS